MADLDSFPEIQKLDSKNLAGSIEQLGKQCEQVWQEVGKIEFLPDLSSAKQVVVMGMGGSTLGAHVIHSLYFDKLKTPIEIVNGYHVPGYVDSDTLVVLSSYSGTTEEVLTAYQEAKEKGAKAVAISSGGELGKLVEGKEVSGYVFEPKFNPSGQPRMGLGYSILGQVLILAKLGFLEFSEGDFAKVVAVVDKTNESNRTNVETADNLAKQTAQKFLNKLPFLFASEHLVGNIHVFANQINENAKSLSAYFALPEANHHLIEGLVSPDARSDVTFFLLKSNLYSPRIVKRYDITNLIFEKNGLESIIFEPQSTTKLEQVFEFLTFGSWVSFYLAILYGRDPAPIPNVDFLKSEMTKP